MEGHRTAERRSLAYHREIAARIAADPTIVERARRRVAGWRDGREVHSTWSTAWAELLEGPTAQLCEALGDPGERMTALRQVTPFAGALDPATRWRLWRSVR